MDLTAEIVGKFIDKKEEKQREDAWGKLNKDKE